MEPRLSLEQRKAIFKWFWRTENVVEVQRQWRHKYRTVPYEINNCTHSWQIWDSWYRMRCSKGQIWEASHTKKPHVLGYGFGTFWAIVNRVGGSVLYSRLHYRWTSTFKFVFRCSNYNLGSILMLINLLSSNASMTYVSLINLQTSYYTLLLFFGPTLKYIKYISHGTLYMYNLYLFSN